METVILETMPEISAEELERLMADAEPEIRHLLAGVTSWTRVDARQWSGRVPSGRVSVRLGSRGWYVVCVPDGPMSHPTVTDAVDRAAAQRRVMEEAMGVVRG